MPKYFCNCCDRYFHCPREHKVSFHANLKPTIPENFWSGRRKSSALCRKCYRKLDNLCAIINPDGSRSRVISLPSKKIKGHRGKRINSLFAVDAIQKDAVIVYRGFHANYDELIAFEKEFGKVLDTTWAVNAPLDSQGRKGMIFGQIGTTDDPFACAHLLNAKLGANDVTANARFGVLDVAKARDIYPQIPSCIPDTARWPVVRISDAIPSRGELVLRTYGATYWHGKPSTCILKGLTPAEREWFEQQRK